MHAYEYRLLGASFSVCIMWLTYLVAEFIGTGFKFRQRKENSLSCVHVLHKTLNLVISHCCFIVKSKEVHQNIKHVAEPWLYFSLEPTVYSFPSLSGLLKLPNYIKKFDANFATHQHQFLTHINDVSSMMSQGAPFSKGLTVVVLRVCCRLK